MSRDGPEGRVVADRLWKRFRADRRRALARDEMERLRARLRGEGDRYWRWVLRDVSFGISPGEAVGLVGSNGSGKSTLLKILTQVMYPYAGRVEVGGRVGALIEIRAGIHPDLTGRENTFLFGILLGLSRAEVARRFDEIVEFAELSDAIDRQVKFYSSGMQMRLGFAVAAFLEPDVLLVDEVLAVGDAAFQQKCLDRMRQVLADGTTLVLVSHDLQAVEATCSRGIWLRDGVVESDGPIRETLGAYRRAIEESAAAAQLGGAVRLVKASVTGPDGDGVVRTQEPCDVTLVVDSERTGPGTLHVGVSEGTAAPVFIVRHEVDLAAGQAEVRCRLDRVPLPRGHYYVWGGMLDAAGADLLPWHPIASFDVEGPDLDPAPRAVVRLAPVHVDARWEVERR